MEKILSIQELCDYLSISRRTILRWIKANKLSFIEGTKSFRLSEVQYIANYVSSREVARRKGRVTYNEDLPCRHGHTTVRYVKDGRCKGCLDAKNIKNIDNHKLVQKRWYNQNKTKEQNKSLAYYYNNKDRIKEVQAKYRKKHPHKYKAKLAKRRAIKKQAIPVWANLEKIKEVYKNCPKGYQVDHIIPLQSDLVCGLHVDYNLQYLTPEENQRKWNKFQQFQSTRR